MRLGVMFKLRDDDRETDRRKEKATLAVQVLSHVKIILGKSYLLNKRVKC